MQNETILTSPKGRMQWWRERVPFPEVWVVGCQGGKRCLKEYLMKFRLACYYGKLTS